MTQIDPPVNAPPRPPPPVPQTRSVLEEIEETDRAAEEQRRRASSGPSTASPPPPQQQPPPPRPSATDEAPEGREDRHPLAVLASDAAARFDAAHRACDMVTMLAAMQDLQYAITEMEKRLRAARAAGQFSSVKPEDIQRNIDAATEQLREMNRRILQCPPRPVHQPFL